MWMVENITKFNDIHTGSLCQTIQDRAKLNWGCIRHSYFESAFKKVGFNRFSEKIFDWFLIKSGLSKMASNEKEKITKQT